MSDKWQTCKLHDVSDIIVSNVDKKFSTAETPVRLCNYLDVYLNNYISKSIEFMNASASKAEIDRFSLFAGDVVITKDSETPDDIGISAVITESIDRLVCGYHLAIIRPLNEKVNAVYLSKQLFSSPIVKYFAINASGSTRYGLSIGVIENLEIPLAPKPEQDKIAEILSTIDRAIEQTEALIAKQQRIKAGVMQDLLTCGIDEQGNLRSEETHEFKDSPLGRIPVEWAVERLSVRVMVKGGKRLPAGHNYAEGDTNFRYLRTMDFINKPLTYTSLNNLFPRTFRLLERYEITHGDVFLSIAGVNLGVAGVFRPDFEERTILTENAAKLSLVTDEIPEYLSIQLNGPLIQKQILEDKGIGAGVPKLALHRIQSFDIPWPAKNEQVQIVRLIAQIESCINAQYRALNKLHSQRSALMQDLLTGKRRVTALLPKPEEAST